MITPPLTFVSQVTTKDATERAAQGYGATTPSGPEQAEEERWHSRHCDSHHPDDARPSTCGSKEEVVETMVKIKVKGRHQEKVTLR